MRHVLVILHRYAGLGMALFLIIAGLTGSILAFAHELDAWLNPTLFHVKQSGPPLGFSDLAQRVEVWEPRLRVARLAPADDVDSSALVTVEPRLDPRSQQPYLLDFEEVFVNPVTGAVLGTRYWGAFRLDAPHAIPFIYRLHDRLTLPGSWGLWLMGAVSVVWVLDCFIGAYLTLPRNRRHWVKWRHAWTINWRASKYRLNVDLHRAGGLWPWLLLLMLAVSSVSLNLRAELFKPVVSAFSPVTPNIFDLRQPEAGETVPVLSFDQAAEMGALEAARLNWSPILAQLSYISGFDIYILQYRSAGTWHDDSRWIYLDGQDGRVLDHEWLGMGTAGDIFTLAQFPLHSGRLFGLAGRIVIACSGVMVTVLAVTGVIIWHRKRKSRRARSYGNRRAESH